MAMKAYESYKNVDLPWLKRMPEHWEVATVNTLFFNNEEKNEKCTVTAAYQFKFGKIVKKPNFELTNDLIETYKNYALVRPNDIMINGLNLNYDFVTQRVGIVQEPGIITSSYISIRPYIHTNAKLYTYLFKAWDAQKVFNGMGTGIRRTLSWKELKQVTIPVPPKEEQDQIVRYLDWQNSRLNKLINAKKKEIALLEEQKQALISQAVTKGLDPHAPLKDSGIDWIGQIPEHWEINRLKDVSTLKTGSTPKTQFTEYFNGDIPWFTPGDFSSNILNTAERTLTQKAKFDGAATIIPPNSILLICIGGTVGKVGLSPIECSCNQQITAFTNLKCDSKYLLYWLLGNKVHLKGTASYTTLPILNNQTVGNYPFIAPYEFTIQHEIANHLDKKCFTIDAAINNINKTISFLQEYRTRLVADVVTGQIDVRNIAIPNYETVTETIDQPETTEDEANTTEE